MKYLDGIMGVVVGDALGSPAQFHKRGEVVINNMIPCEHFGMPAGSWTDDSSLTLATLASIRKCGKIDLVDISENFVRWLQDGMYTPFGYAYDIGATCYDAIMNYRVTGAVPAGLCEEENNGNGSLMRIMPACLSAHNVNEVEAVSALTHAHHRAQIGCGLYYFIVNSIVNREAGQSINDCIKFGLKDGFEWYHGAEELRHYGRLRNVESFSFLPENKIQSTGYVVHTLEAALWSLLNSDSYRSALLKAVNLGYDADSVGAVCGGLAGLYYGFNQIPKEWVDKIQAVDDIKRLCNLMDKAAN